MGAAFPSGLVIVGAALARTIDKLFKGHLGPLFDDSVEAAIENQTLDVQTRAGGPDFTLTFYVPNALCLNRAKTFHTKEPETLSFLEEFSGGVLWDVGANIGIYSVFYAGCCGGEVYSFEPAIPNLNVLAKNLYNNCDEGSYTIFPLALSDRAGVQSMHLKTQTVGGALHSFGVTFSHDGKAYSPEVAYRLPGFSGDFLVRNKMAKQPNVLKIDVDGTEHLILNGMKNILKSAECKAVLVEINENFEEQAISTARTLSDSGYSLVSKAHTSANPSPDMANVFNQIWTKTDMSINGPS